jgi:hypothetical protein
MIIKNVADLKPGDSYFGGFGDLVVVLRTRKIYDTTHSYYFLCVLVGDGRILDASTSAESMFKIFTPSPLTHR